MKTLPAKYLYELRDERVGKGLDLPLLSVSLYRGVVPRSEMTGTEPRADDLSNYKLCRPNEIVINRMSAFQGAIGISHCHGIVSPEYLVLRPRNDVDARFLTYLMKSTWFVGEMTARVRGIGSADQGNVRTPRINPSDLGSIPVSVPPLMLQQTIADYLDSTTTRIDALIAKKRRMIDLLEERVNAQVSDYIRRSPLAGEGEIEVVPIRRVLTKLERWADGGNMVTAFRDGEVTTREARNREGFTNAWTETARVQQVEVGDVVIHGLDGFSGAIGDARRAGVCSPVYHVCTLKQGDSTFYGRMLRLLAVTGYLGNFAISTRERAVDFRNWDLFGRIPVPLVPTDEQRAIGDEIRKIRPLRDRIAASEALALEYRQALITAAVTGELEIAAPEAVA